MGKPYSIDLRKRVGAEIASGQSRRAAARRYDVSASFAVKLADRISQTGRRSLRDKGVRQVAVNWRPIWRLCWSGSKPIRTSRCRNWRPSWKPRRL